MDARLLTDELLDHLIEETRARLREGRTADPALLRRVLAEAEAELERRDNIEREV